MKYNVGDIVKLYWDLNTFGRFGHYKKLCRVIKIDEVGGVHCIIESGKNWYMSKGSAAYVCSEVIQSL